jgi:hypothetical protein
VVIVELGAYYFVYLPNRSVAPGPSQGRDVAESVEETAPKTPSRRSTPPPSKTQYQP